MAATQSQPSIFRIKDGKLNQWTEWCQQINEALRDRAEATLKDEGILYEFFITFEINGSHYTLGAEITPNGTDPKTADSTNPINEEHRRMKKDCLELVAKGDFAYLIRA
jgi:hypothetical protein